MVRQYKFKYWESISISLEVQFYQISLWMYRCTIVLSSFGQATRDLQAVYKDPSIISALCDLLLGSGNPQVTTVIFMQATDDVASFPGSLLKNGKGESLGMRLQMIHCHQNQNRNSKKCSNRTWWVWPHYSSCKSALFSVSSLTCLAQSCLETVSRKLR